MIVENKLLIDKVNDLIGKKEEDSICEDNEKSEVDLLSSSMIEALYEQVEMKNKNKGNKK